MSVKPGAPTGLGFCSPTEGTVSQASSWAQGETEVVIQDIKPI